MESIELFKEQISRLPKAELVDMLVDKTNKLIQANSKNKSG